MFTIASANLQSTDVIYHSKFLTDEDQYKDTGMKILRKQSQADFNKEVILQTSESVNVLTANL